MSNAELPQQEAATKPCFLSFKDTEYDYHTLLKTARKNSHLGEIKVHEGNGSYIVSFHGCVPEAPGLFSQYLNDLECNRAK